MPQPYNLTNLSSANNIVGTTQAANQLSDGLLGGGLMILLFIVLFWQMKTYSAKTALLGSTFIVALLSIPMRVLTLITDVYMFGAFILFAAALAIAKWVD